MSMKCYFSNRIYKSKLNEKALNIMSDTHQLYNSKLHTVYNLQILEKRGIETLGWVQDKNPIEYTAYFL